MEAYTGFAQVYDKFMDNIEYDKWCEYLVSILKEYGVNYGIVLVSFHYRPHSHCIFS